MIRWLQTKGLLWFIRIGFMTAITGFNFWLAVVRWGILDPDPRVRVSAIIIAGGSELGLFAFMVLFHGAFYRPQRHWSRLASWGAAALLCIAISLYVNYEYFSAKGESLIDLGIRAFLPMVFLVGFAMIPPKIQRVRTAADVHAEYEGKIAEAELKQKLKDIERQAQRKEQEEKEERRTAREALRAERLQMVRLAREAWGDERVETFSVRSPDGFEFDTDYLGLEQAMRVERLWPPTIAQLPSVEEMIAAANSTEEDDREEVSDPNMDAITSAGEPKWWTAEYIAARYNIPLTQVRLRMKADYRGKFKKIPSRWIIVAGKKVRKAYYKRVQAIMEDDNVQEDLQADVQVLVEAGV